MLLLRGHSAKGLCVAFSPDGTLLASGSADKTIRLWRAGASEHLATLTGHRFAVMDLAFSPDGATLVSGSADGTLRVWGVGPAAAGQALQPKHPAGWWKTVRFSPDGRFFAGGGGDGSGATLWGTTPWQERKHLDTEGENLWGLAFSPDGRTLALALQKSGVRLHDLGGGADRSFAVGGTVRGLAFAPDGRTLAVATAWAVELWDVASGQRRQKLAGHTGLVWAVAYSADGRVLISGSKDDSVRVWDAYSGVLLGAYDWKVGGINSVAITPDGSLAAACGTRRGIVIWDVE